MSLKPIEGNRRIAFDTSTQKIHLVELSGGNVFDLGTVKISAGGIISVATLPTASAALKGKIYHLTTDNGLYKVNFAGDDWEPIGSGDANNLGFYATEAALNAAHPTATEGNYASVGETDTFWFWDAVTSAWVNSGATAGVVSFNGRTGAVSPEAGDYSSHYDALGAAAAIPIRVYADLTAAKAGTPNNGDQVYITSLETYYAYNSVSTQYGNDWSCIAVTAGGRLISKAGKYFSATSKFVCSTMTEAKAHPTAEVALGDRIGVAGGAGDELWMFRAVTETIASDLIERKVDDTEAYVLYLNDEVGTKRLILSCSFDFSKQNRWMNSVVATTAGRRSALYGYNANEGSDTQGRSKFICVHPYNAITINNGPQLWHSNTGGSYLSADYGNITNVGGSDSSILNYAFIRYLGQSVELGYSDVPANLSAANVYRVSGNTFEFLATSNGYFTDIQAVLSAARTAGTLSLKIAINGTPIVATGLDLTINAGTTNYARAKVATGISYLFNAGNRISLQITTSADWTPITADLDAAIGFVYSA